MSMKNPSGNSNILKRMRRGAVTAATVGVLSVGLGAGGLAATASAGDVEPMGGINGPLCTILGDWIPASAEMGGPTDYIMWGAPNQFRRHEAYGNGWSYGHSSASFPTDWWVRNSDISC